LATIAEMEASMTVYYSKNTGIVKRVASGIQDMSLFGVEEEDYSVIWSFIVIAIDNYVIQNPDKFIMDVSSATPVLSLKEANIYPVI